MEEQLVILIVVGSLGLLLMAGSVVFFVVLYQRRVLRNKVEVREIQVKHQEQMLKATLESQEKERERVGTELHDSIGAMLSTIKMSLKVASQSPNSDTTAIVTQIDETIGQVRSISHQMMPVILKKYGLGKAIDELAGQVNGRTNLQIRVISKEVNEFQPEQELMIYRILQELINNTIKHSGAEQITISFRKVGNFTRFIYRDNGKGYPKELLRNNDGLGLWNIKNRAQVLNGLVDFSNAPEGGAKVIMDIPRANG